jgi:sugar O-acyltransferase (sialic acid O-acetyltransferase NeuD family)
MNKIFILGKGGHSKSIYNSINNEDVECTDNNFFKLNFMKYQWILGFGNLHQRRDIIDNYKNVNFKTIIHPTAIISRNSIIGDGVFIGANAYIGPNVKIGDHCIINTHSVIEHDCIIDDNVHISVNTTLCGKCNVSKNSFIGANSVCIPNTIIGENVYIGAGIKVEGNILSNHFYDGKILCLKKSCIKSEEKKINWCAIKPLNINRINDIIQISVKANKFTNNGPVVKILEDFIKDKFKLEKEVHMTSSGTSALHSIISSLNIMNNKNLKFATQAFTFPSAVLGPLKDSIIVDNDPIFLGPCLNSLEKIKDNIDGIIVTNVFGCICDIMKYRQWCDNNSKFLIFDNAATPVAYINHQNNLTNICDIADASIISFHETKFFGRGEGGAVICSKELWPFVNRSVNFGFIFGETVRKFHFEASNWRMSDFNAAFLLYFLEYIFEPRIINKAFELSDYCNQLVLKSNLFTLLYYYPEKTVFSGICLRTENIITEELIQKIYKETKIEVKKYYVPLLDKESVPNAWNMYNSVICIPFHLQILKEDIDFIFENLNKYF